MDDMDHTTAWRILGSYKDKFSTLLSMVQTINSVKDIGEALKFVTFDLVEVMDVRAISVKLLSEDGKFLKYVASYGLPPDFIRDRVVEVGKSPLNNRIIQGEPFVTGKVTQRETFQFGEDLAASRIQSVLFVPLTVKSKVIGILGAYCVLPDRFTQADVEFFRLAAGLVAMRIENLRSNEAIEGLMTERSRFMMRVAHNLRAPLAAVLSMLDILREQSLGALNDNQAEYLRRIDRRSRTMLSMINELMTLSTSRTVQRKLEKQPLEGDWLAGRLQRTFNDKAVEKGITLIVNVAPKLPTLWANSEMVEQTLENLVSNAIKYTPEGGRVEVNFFRADVAKIGIDVIDTGIGIPEDSMAQLFSEFFRAPNAKEMEEIGTGLGLAIVKEYVELHGGSVAVESKPGQGARFRVLLPIGAIAIDDDE